MYCCPTRCTVIKRCLIFNDQDGGLEMKFRLGHNESYCYSRGVGCENTHSWCQLPGHEAQINDPLVPCVLTRHRLPSWSCCLDNPWALIAVLESMITWIRHPLLPLGRGHLRILLPHPQMPVCNSPSTTCDLCRQALKFVRGESLGSDVNHVAFMPFPSAL